MIFNWFETSDLDFATDQWVNEFSTRCSTEDVEKGGKKAEFRFIEAQEALLKRAKEYADANKLNIYKKSRLANRIKWSLLDRGYPKPIVDDLAYRLASAVTMTKKM
jgi:hypothetical protein